MHIESDIEGDADPVRDLRRYQAQNALVPLFLVSGATSLIYEILWERQLHLVVGTSQVSVVTVLAAFMGGLAAGGFLASRIVDKLPNPLMAYASLEALIGLYALIFPTLVGLAKPLYAGFWQWTDPSPTAFALFQFGLATLLLLPPTICMGATLPLLTRFAAPVYQQTGHRVGQLYGANTIGAVIGVGLAGFVLLPQLGLMLTTLVAAASNLTLAAVAASLAKRAGPMEPVTDIADPATERADTQGHFRILAIIAMVSGGASLIYEVSWFRLMVLNLGGSAYAFSVMLLAFLLGIGSGGWWGGKLADRPHHSNARSLLVLVAKFQVAIAATTYLSMFLFGELPFAFVRLYTTVEPIPALLWPAKLLLAMSLMVPPALLIGATFPALVKAATRDHRIGKPVGQLYGWNTSGAIIGTIVGGLVLLPMVHVEYTIPIAVALNLGAGGLAWWASRRGSMRKPWALPIVVTAGGIGLTQVIHPPWDPLLMTAGMYKYVSDLAVEERTREGVLDYAVNPYELVFYDEGLSSVVTVARSKKTGNMWLANNGKVDASTRVDMPTQLLVAHLPFVFQPEPDKVLVIGLASGITAGSVALHSAANSIDIVELEPAVVAASHLFDDVNNRPLEDPRVQLIANDGRNHLTLTPDGTYDLVVSEPSNPWLTGVSNLFTQEFFEMGKAKLSENGVWSQWVQMYGIDTDDLRTLLGTFADVFPHVLLFSTIEDADIVMIGSQKPLDLTVDLVQQMMDNDRAVHEDLALIECAEPEDLLTRLYLNRDQIVTFAEGSPKNTDDNMNIEYSAPLHLHDSTAAGNFFELLNDSKGRQTIPLYAVDGPEGHFKLAEAYGRREDWLRGLITLKAADELDPTNPQIEILYNEYQSALAEALAEE